MLMVCVPVTSKPQGDRKCKNREKTSLQGNTALPETTPVPADLPGRPAANLTAAFLLVSLESHGEPKTKEDS